MERTGLSGLTLKWVALITMLIDHFAVVFYIGSIYGGNLIFSYSTYMALRAVGRLAFPIYCFLLAEGYRHTRSVERYLLRLFAFGVLSELPFDMALCRSYVDWSYQNVYFTLFLGLLAVFLWDLATQKAPERCGAPRVLLGLLSIAAAACLAHFCQTDYGEWGVLTIVAMCLFSRSEWQRNLFSGCMLLGAGALEAVGLSDFLLFHFYNGRRGRQSKYLFYAFYPCHLLALALLCRAVYGV